MLGPGTTVGRYVIKRKLAEGGMAEIFLASAVGPEGFSKEVVIKIIRSFLASDSQFVQMFIAEARLASKLNHANVVQIFDFGKHGDSYYLAMEYVRGASLWDLRKRCRELGTPFPPLLAAEIGAQVARGLQYAHNLTDHGQKIGVVHRDVTPHNVLLSFDGAVKLTDFGIAKATTTHTAPGMLKGKFAYMSPEQSKGERVDARTDLFALGIVLWELLTGGRLFDGDSDLAVLRAVQDSLIPPPSRMNPDVPRELSDVVMKALARPLDERFQSGFELERALATWVLRNAQSLDDTSVANFVQQVFREEFEAPQQPAPEPALDDTEPDDFGAGSTVYKQRHHTAQTATPIGPAPGTRSEATPSKVRGLNDDDAPAQRTEEFVAPGAAPRPRTEQMPVLKRPTSRRFDPLPVNPPSIVDDTPPSVVVRPSVQLDAVDAPGDDATMPPSVQEPKTMPPLASGLQPRVEPKTMPPTGSHPAHEERTVPPTGERPAYRAGTGTEESLALATRSSRGPLMIVLGVVLLGVIGTAVFITQRPEGAEVLPPETPPVEAVVATPAPQVEPAPEPPKQAPEVTDPVGTVTPPEAPEPSAPEPRVESGVTEPKPTTPKEPAPRAPPPKPAVTRAHREQGTINVRAMPFATVLVQGKSYEVTGVKAISAPVGTYEIVITHPKKQLKQTITVSPNQVTQVAFSAN